MKQAWSLLLATALAVSAATCALAATDMRFSQTLNADERTASGITRLNSDQVAVIDALVRRDTGRLGAQSSSTAANDGDTAPKTFSQRLTADERRTAGLTALTETELPKLDALIDRHQGAKLARSLLGPLSVMSRPSRVTPTEARPEGKIHGSFSLSYGWGKGGYSEKTGSMILNYDDPEGRYSITFGYTESHVKGPQVYRDPYYDYSRGSLLDHQPPFRP